MYDQVCNTTRNLQMGIFLKDMGDVSPHDDEAVFDLGFMRMVRLCCIIYFSIMYRPIR